MPGKPNQSSKGLVSIDIARAIAAISVFYYHLHAGSLLADISGFQWFKYTDALGALYAVPLFFLISGYCIHLSNLKYLENDQQLPVKQYYKRRILRIYPPYLIALVLSIVVNVITGNGLSSKNEFFVHLFLLQSFTNSYFATINVVLWTVSIEMALYILYPVFYYIRLKFSLNLAISLAFIVSCISITYYTLKSHISINEQYSILNLWFAWCCGAFIADKKILGKFNFKTPLYIVIYCVIVAAFVLLNICYQKLEIITYQLSILIWTAPLLFLLGKEKWLAGQHSFLVKLFTGIGLSSYSLYLLHQPLIELKNFWVHKYLPSYFQLPAILMGILVIPVITWFSYLYIEKPFMVKKTKLN